MNVASSICWDELYKSKQSVRLEVSGKDKMACAKRSQPFSSNQEPVLTRALAKYWTKSAPSFRFQSYHWT